MIGLNGLKILEAEMVFSKKEVKVFVNTVKTSFNKLNVEPGFCIMNKNKIVLKPKEQKSVVFLCNLKIYEHNPKLFYVLCEKYGHHIC